MSQLTRRQMLTAIAQIAAATSLASCGASSENEASPNQISSAVSSATDLDILASIAYTLFPHERLTPELYIKVAQSIMSLEEPVVTAGIDQIRSLSQAGSWLELEEEQRVNILTSLQETEFFALMRSSTINVLYKDPVGIEFVGYGGSAIEYGGYLDRGFDDIDWLPEQGAQ